MSSALSLRKIAAALPLSLDSDAQGKVIFSEEALRRCRALSAVTACKRGDLLLLSFASDPKTALRELRRQHVDVRAYLSQDPEDAEVRCLTLGVRKGEAALEVFSGSDELRGMLRTLSSADEGMRVVKKASDLDAVELARSEKFMRLALEQTQLAAEAGEVPVGAVCVDARGDVLSAAHNLTLTLKDPTAHAEVLALRAACEKTGSERLCAAELYVTVEPCCMCAGAVMSARARRVVFGASEARTGACGGMFSLLNDVRQQHRVEIISGVMRNECASLMRGFFESRR